MRENEIIYSLSSVEEAFCPPKSILVANRKYNCVNQEQSGFLLSRPNTFSPIQQCLVNNFAFVQWLFEFDPLKVRLAKYNLFPNDILRRLQFANRYQLQEERDRLTSGSHRYLFFLN